MIDEVYNKMLNDPEITKCLELLKEAIDGKS